MIAAVVPTKREDDGWLKEIGFFDRVFPSGGGTVWSDNRVAIGASGWGTFHRDDRLGLAIAFDGELFNRGELREQFLPRSEATDGELVAAAYKARGSDAWDLFDGDFAFLVWDAQENKTFAVRDRFGVRPLHFTRTNRGLIFASSIEDLVSGAQLPFEPDSVMIRDWLFNRFETRRTFWKAIEQVLPGHSVVVDGGTIRQERYFFPQVDPELAKLSPEGAASAFRDAVVSSTADCVNSRRKVMIHLSGGLDSATLAFSAKQLVNEGRLRKDRVILGSSRFGDEEHDEGQAMRIAAQDLPFEWHCWDGRQVDGADLVAPIRAWPWGRRANNHGPGDLDLAAQQGVDTVLSGLGGDELTLTLGSWFNALVRRRWSSARKHAFRADGGMRPGLASAMRQSLPSFVSDLAYKRCRSAQRLMAGPPNPFVPLIPELPWQRDNNEWLDGSGDRVAPGFPRAVWRRLVNPRLWRTVSSSSRMWEDAGIRVRFPLLRKRVVQVALSVAATGDKDVGNWRQLERDAIRLLASERVLSSRTKKTFNAELGRYGRANAGAITRLLLSRIWKSGEFLNQKALQREFSALLALPLSEDAQRLRDWRYLLLAIHLEAWWQGNEPLYSPHYAKC